MRNNNSITVSDMFYSLLTVAFIVLKLCHVIEWSWLWVLAPMWIPFVIGVIILLVMK